MSRRIDSEHSNREERQLRVSNWGWSLIVPICYQFDVRLKAHVSILPKKKKRDLTATVRQSGVTILYTKVYQCKIRALPLSSSSNLIRYTTGAMTMIGLCDIQTPCSFPSNPPKFPVR